MKLSHSIKGTLEDRYQIYLDNTNDAPVKTFDEWLNS